MKFTFSPESRPLEGYTIKRAIYRGGFGEVYYAVSDAGRDVALKLLQNNAEIELRGVQQCLNLSHQNLVTIFDVRQYSDGYHWIIMEYVPGETLDTTIRRYPNGMPMEEIRRWMHGIVGGIEFVHERGIVHRDLKPGNIFAAPSGAKVGDVGLSKFISASQRSAQTQSVGTVYYMAPEVAQGRYGKEIDVYALGVILYEMLTGQVPFDGESTGEILMKHLSQPPDLNRLPERLRPVIARALAKDPQYRQPSVSTFLRAFDDAVVGRSQPEPAPGPRRFAECGPRRSATHGTRKACWTGRSDGRSSAPGPFPSFGRGLMFVAVLMILISLTRGHFHRGTIIVSGLATLYLIGYGTYALGKALWREAQFLFGTSQPGGRSIHSVPRSPMPVVPPPRGTASAEPLRPAPSPLVRTATAKDRWLAWSSTSFLAPFVVLPLTAGIAWLQPSLFHSSKGWPDTGAFALFAGTAVLATWVLSAINTIQAGRNLESSTRRVVLGLGGVAIGLGAAFLGDWLLGLQMLDPSSKGFRHLGERSLVTAGGQPNMLAFGLYFASLAASVRWWRQSTSARPGRFQVAPLIVSTVAAYCWTFAWPIPQEWGVMWGAVISATLQIASPWSAPSPRLQQA